MYLDSSTMDVLLVLLALVLGVYAQFAVRATYNKFAKVSARSGWSGAAAAQDMLRRHDCGNTGIERIAGQLTDHFDPRTQTLRLSEGVYGEASISALSIAAHEVGHVLQRSEGYAPMKVRQAIVPAANIGSRLAIPLLLIGFWLEMMQMVYVGIALYALALVFHLITLPVEFDASRRAMHVLETGGYLASDELPKARKVLNAAALTYVAATLAVLAQLMRFFGMASRRR